jgi:56kDa selenium binding protein (SBP56)
VCAGTWYSAAFGSRTLDEPGTTLHLVMSLTSAMADVRTSLLLLVGLVWGFGTRVDRTNTGTAPSRYLYIWAGDKDKRTSDFLATVDVAADSPTYGDVVATEPVGMSGTLPHHMEYELPASSQLLFANGHHREQLFLFDVRKAARPRLARTLPTVKPYRFPHDIVRLPTGNVLVGHLRGPGPSPVAGDTNQPGGHGGIAELDPQGRVLRVVSAADSGVSAPIRPYTFTLLPGTDRMVMTSAPMMEDNTAHVVQIRRVSDLGLVRTLRVPPAILPDGKVQLRGHEYPFEPRIMPDGTVLLSTYACGFYHITGAEGDTPEIRSVYTMEMPPKQLGECGIPVLAGRFWIMAVGALHSLIALDVSNPTRPREVARLLSDTTFRPHWLARDPGSDRVVVGAQGGGEDRMLVARVNTRTGHLKWDESLRSEDGQLGINLRRENWPHGASGEAFAHAALFSR